MTFEEALEKIKRDNLDLSSLIKTDEYKIVCNKICMRRSFNQEFYGYELDLIGDLVEFKLYDTDCMTLVIIFSILGSQPVYAGVEVYDEDLKKQIREKAKTNKGVHLRVKCLSGGVDKYELIEIKDLDMPLVFGQWVCSECGYNYKYDDPQGYKCCICNSEIKEVHDFYN